MSLPGGFNGLARFGIMGQPYHGLAVQPGSGNATVVLPNSATKDIGRTLASGDTRLSQRPGWSAITRDTEGAAADTANGWQWPNWFMFGGVFPLTAGNWVFFDSDGSAWQVYLQKGTPSTLKYRRFGVFSAAAAPAWQTLSISGSYANIVGTLYPQNHTPDGTKYCYHLAGDSAIGNKILEITLTGSGGSGPATATISIAGDLILQDTFSDSVTYEIWTQCGENTDDDILNWDTCQRSVTWEGVQMSDYISGALVHTTILVEASVDASASLTEDCSLGYYGYSNLRTETIQWIYSVKIKRGSTSYISIFDVVVDKTIELGVSIPVFGAGDPSRWEDITTLITVDGATYGAGTSHYKLTEYDAYWWGVFKGAIPGLNIDAGIGDYSDEMVVPGPTSTPVVTWPGYGYGGGFGLIGNFQLEITGLISNCPHIGSPSITNPYGLYISTSVYESFGLRMWLDRSSNNVLTVHHQDCPPVISESFEDSYGPCIATDAWDTDILEAPLHYATYHPITKQLTRSTTQQVCFF